jgi:hypothetical protein
MRRISRHGLLAGAWIITDSHRRLAMSGSKKSQPDTLAKTSKEGAIELSETQLDGASGGAVFPSSPAISSLKLDSSHKINTDPALLLPAVKPGQ